MANTATHITYMDDEAFEKFLATAARKSPDSRTFNERICLRAYELAKKEEAAKCSA